MRNKMKKILVLSLTFILFISNTMISQAATQVQNVKEQYLSIQNSLTAQDFITAGNLLSSSDIENYNEKELDLYVMKLIVENHDDSNVFLPNGNTEPPTEYLGLNPAERALAVAHPFEATQYYISSQVAINYTMQYFGYSGTYDPSDAFRHACWNAVLTLRIGSSRTKIWTDAHETTSYGIDKEMDLFNNDLGRRLASDVDGAGYPEYNTKPLVEKVYNAVKLGMGRIIVNGKLHISAF